MGGMVHRWRLHPAHPACPPSQGSKLHYGQNTRFKGTCCPALTACAPPPPPSMQRPQWPRNVQASFADLFQLAGAAATIAMGGPKDLYHAVPVGEPFAVALVCVC